MRHALGRRLSLGAGARKALKDKIDALAELERFPLGHEAAIRALRQEIKDLELRLKRIPFLDPLDLRFRGVVKTPVPMVKAVMFCLMDVSGSMDESRKNLAKQFFILLYLFLTRHYEKIDIVFIRHQIGRAHV